MQRVPLNRADTSPTPPVTILSWRVTTEQALTSSIVPDFLNIVGYLLEDYAFDEDAVATALHEAVSNGAIHGNLSLVASRTAGLEAADALARSVDRALHDPELCARPLVIAAQRHGARLVLSVRDSGRGFNAGRVQRADNGQSYGRGIELMRRLASSVEYRHGGRQVCLTFDLHRKFAGIATHDPAASVRPDTLASRILVVDDSVVQRELIAHCLQAAGFTNIAYANDGHEALQRYFDFRPDLILLDLAMPGMSGFEVCRALSARDDGAVPILIESNSQLPEERVRAFEAGAVDFITKPFYPPELVARVRTQLENRCLLRSLHQFRSRLSDELGAARLMQRSLIPSAETLAGMRATTGLDIAAHSEMSSELGGDIWGVRIIDETRVGVFIADFTGHGVASAANAFRLHALLGESGIRFERPDLVMQALNVRLHGVLPTGNFATLFYGVLDMARNRLDYAAAGAPAPVIILPDGSLLEIDSTGVPVGIRRGTNTPCRRSISRQAPRCSCTAMHLWKRQTRQAGIGIA